jgi:glycosyltransferase involved in cell wall biosynthesis
MNVLFVGKGRTGVCWYRAALPATHLGIDWCGVHGEPDEMQVLTGVFDGTMSVERFFDYDVVVMQQARGTAWAALITRLRAAGVTVLYEIDDDLHALRKKADHDFSHQWTPELLRDIEVAMAACDGLIVSTDHLAKRYARPERPAWVCRNGIDLSRYALTLPERSGVTVGWAGGTGHYNAVVPWLHEVDRLMRERSDVSFVSLGQPFADMLHELHSPERALSLPFTMLESYPAAMTLMDIALAPAGRSNFYLAKSDLRWLEASALGIPTIADPEIYPEIEHGVTGFHAATAAEAGEHMRLLAGDAELRRRVGAQAQAYVREHRSMQVAAEQWREVFAELTGTAPVSAAA